MPDRKFSGAIERHIGPGERERLGKVPGWVRALIMRLVEVIESLEARVDPATLGPVPTLVHDLTRDQRSLLLYLETRGVDYAGRVDGRRMNEADFAQARAWAESGFIAFGRIRMDDINRDGAHWVRLSPLAQHLAAVERRERAERLWAARRYRTTAEKRRGAA